MPNVKVLLKEKVEKLGDIGEIVSVKPGYARNFLLPQNLGVIPTLGEIKRIQKRKELLEKQYKEEKTKAEEVANKLTEAGDFVIFKASGEASKLYGAVTTKDIAEKIESQLGIEIPRKQILLKRSIGELGEYNINIKLHQEVTTQIKLLIKSEESK